MLFGFPWGLLPGISVVGLLELGRFPDVLPGVPMLPGGVELWPMLPPGLFMLLEGLAGLPVGFAGAPEGYAGFPEGFAMVPEPAP